MNWKNLSIATLFAALSLGAVAAQAQDRSPAASYMYGDHLDIAKVLAINESGSAGCGVVKAHMTYLDSMGQQQTLNYSTVGENCDQDN